MKRLFFIILITLANYSAKAQLSGIFTIDSSGNGNYLSFSAAVAALNSNGINGSCVFIVQPGTYNEQLYLTPVAGASEQNQIAFVGNSTDSLAVNLQFAQSSFAGNYVIRFDGADYFTFKKMTIQSLGLIYSKVISLENQANYNHIENCRIVGKQVNVSYEDNAVIWSGTTRDQYNQIVNNSILNGSYGIYMVGNSSNYEYQNLYSGNQILDFYYYGIKADFQYNTQFNNNIIRSADTTYTYAYGLYTRYMEGTGSISNNQIEVRGSNSITVLRTDYATGTTANPILISNNFISQTGPNNDYVRGLMIYYSKNEVIYNNSVQVIGGDAADGRAAYFSTTYTSANIKILNNIFANMGPGVAIYHTYDAYNYGMITQCDYNDFYTAGTVLARYADSQRATLADWKTSATGWDIHSVSLNPKYTGPGNLRITNWYLNGLGTYLTQVPTDIDGESRSTSMPDMGADEFNLPGAMHGSYIIDMAGTGNYLSFQDALADLSVLGVDSSVTMFVKDGVYQEKLVINPIPGSSSMHRVRFVSFSGDSTAVVLQNTQSTYAENYTVKLNGVDYLSFEKMTLKTGVSWQYCRVIEITGNAIGIQIDRCILEGGETYGLNPDYAVVYSNAGNDDSLQITNNLILKGSYGVYIKGVGEYSPEKYLYLVNNRLENFSYRGVYVQYSENYQLTGNILVSAIGANAYAYVYGIYLNLNKGNGRITKNVMEMRGSDKNYGLYASNSNSSDTTPTIFANNWVSQVGFGAGVCYGFYVYGGSYQQFLFNSVKVNAGASSSCAAYFTCNSSTTSLYNSLYNNNFAKTGGGYAIYVTQTALESSFFTAVDYNNYYSPLGTLGKLGNYDVNQLSDWQSMSLWDAHSLAVDPQFVTEGDCHLAGGSLLVAAGFPSSLVLDDIDSETRSMTQPTIGADEYQIPFNPLETQTINLPMNWSIFSTYLEPTNPDIDSVFAANISSVIIIKNKNGQAYWPPYVDLIGNLSLGEGYWIKMAASAAVTITGQQVAPETVIISLPANWSLFGFLKDTPRPLINELSSVLSSIIIVKDGNGMVYWPQFGVNLIGNLEPGKGYQINLSQPAQLIYPAN